MEAEEAEAERQRQTEAETEAEEQIRDLWAQIHDLQQANRALEDENQQLKKQASGAVVGVFGVLRLLRVT